MTWGPTFDLDKAAEACAALKGSPAVLAVIPGGVTGCYRCASKQEAVFGLPGEKAPVCLPACAGSDGPDYRRIFSKPYSPYILCTAKGCDDTRCRESKCGKAVFKGPLGAAIHRDEEWEPVPGKPLCTRCPEGHRLLQCRSHYRCPSSHYCLSTCSAQWWSCSVDEDCDVARGIGCAEVKLANGSTKKRCLNLRRCVAKLDCRTNEKCLNHLCHGDKPLDQHTADGLKAYDRSSRLCQQVGCSTCIGNAYCLDHAQDKTTPAGTTHCPLKHSCVTKGTAVTTSCVLRPLLNDAGVELLQAMAPLLGDSGALMQVLPELGALFTDLDLPGKLRDTMNRIKLSERVAKGGLRFLPHRSGKRHQGYLAVVLEMADTVEAEVSCASPSIPAPVVARLTFQPYSYAGRIYVTPLDVGIHHKVQDTAPVSIKGDCYTESCYDGDLQQDFNDGLAGGLDPKIQAQIAASFDQLLQLLTRSMVVGGWLFGRAQALDELDLARDKVAASNKWHGDKDLADEIQRLRIVGSLKPGGWAAVDYLER
jgi:hypothetical protein